MKTPCTIALIGMIGLIPFNPAFGQSKFSVSVIAAPNLYYLDTKLTENLPVGNGTIRPVAIHYNQRGCGYSAGLSANYWFSERWSAATGILVNSVNYEAPTVTTNPDLTANPNGVHILTLGSTVRNFQVPLTVNYRVSTKRLSPYLSAGALTSVRSVRVSEGGGKSGNTVEKIRPHPTLGVGIDYRLNRHLSLIAQPTFVYFLPYKKVTSYKSYQLGLQVQLLGRF